jgi:hypothetical protein
MRISLPCHPPLNLFNRERHGTFTNAIRNPFVLAVNLPTLRTLSKIEACACFRIAKILPVLAETVQEWLLGTEIIFTGIRVLAASIWLPILERSDPPPLFPSLQRLGATPLPQPTPHHLAQFAR